MLIHYARLALLFLAGLLPLSCNKGSFDSSLKRPSSALRIAPEINSGKLDNGMSYYYMRNNKPEGRCFLRLHAGIGSFVESDDELGMAHLLEHMAFEDKAISKDLSLAEWFQKHGMSFGPDANAFTSTEQTIYQIDLPSCEQSSLKDALNILRSFADGLQFNKEELIKQKNIVDAEELESNNTQQDLSKKIIDNLYSGTRLVSRPVLGKAEKRTLFNADMLKSFYHKWYNPKNLSIVLVGDYGEQDPYVLIKESFGDLKAKGSHTKAPDSGKPDYKNPVFIVPQSDMSHVEVVYLVQPKKLIKPNFALNVLKERLAFDLALAMLRNTYAMNAREQKNIIRETGINGFMWDKGIYELSLSTSAKKDNFEENFLNSFRILRHAAEIGFSEQEFNSMRKAFSDYLDQSVIQQATWGSDQWTQLILNHLSRQGYANNAVDYQRWSAPILQELRAKDCQMALVRALKSGNHFIFALGALQDSKENIKALGELLKKASTQKIDAKPESVAISFQYAIPDCSKNKSGFVLKHIKNLDAYSVNLSKNLKVIVKQTKFKQDEILLAIFNDEGFAVMDSKDFTRARMAQLVLPEGGLTKHPPEQIPELLKDKYMSSSFGIFADRLQETVVTRKQDLRFALELMRAYLYDPLYASSTLGRSHENIKIAYEELKHNMWSPLQHDFPRELSGRDHRVGQAPLEDMLAVSREDLLAWHKHFLGNKKLNLVVVGDVEPEQAVKEILCVLAPALESITPTYSSKKAPKLSFKSGIKRHYYIPTKDDASKIVLRYPLNFPGKTYPDHRLPILQNVVQEALRLKLREKKQVTYSPSVMVTSGKNAFAQNWMDVLVTAPKDQAERVLADTKKAIEKLALKGINAQQLEKAKEPYLTQATDLLKENSYWLYNLAENFNELEKMPEQTRMAAQIKAVSLSQINELLRKYLRASKASSAVVHAKPE